MLHDLLRTASTIYFPGVQSTRSTLFTKSRIGFRDVPDTSRSTKSVGTMRRLSTSLLIAISLNSIQCFTPMLPTRGRLRNRPTTRVFDDKAALEEYKEMLDTFVDTVNKAKVANNTDVEIVEQLEMTMDDLENIVLPPVGMTSEEYLASCRVVLKLPLVARLGLFRSVEMCNQPDSVPSNPLIWEYAVDAEKIYDLVKALVENRYELKPAVLQNGRKWAEKEIKKREDGVFGTFSSEDFKMEDSEEIMKQLFNESGLDKSPEQMALDSTLNQLIPRVMRKDRCVLEEECDLVLNELRNVSFSVATKEPIEGGFLIKGKPKVKTLDWLEEINQKLAPKDLALSYTPDLTDFDTIALFDGDPEYVLMLYRKDLSSNQNPLWSISSTALAVLSTIAFSAGVYGPPDLLTKELTSVSPSELASLDFFNLRVLDVMVPVVGIQVAREITQWITAQIYGLKTGIPTVFPFWILPFMGSVTRLKESPKNLSQVFDYAFSGACVGLLASASMLWTGLSLTTQASAEASKLFPSLPVSMLQLSTAGGSLFDNILGGADGFLTQLDPATPVPLHPLAVAGFAGLLIQSLDLLPVGSTNGGRMSLALFGRQGYSAISGFTWLVVLFLSFFGGENCDLLVAAWAVNSIAQADGELLCENETDSITLPRAAMALLTWFAAALVLAPINVGS